MSRKTGPLHRKINRTLRIGMIGPSRYPEGGTSIPFQLLVDRMRSQGVTVHVVPIPRGGRNLLTKPLKFLVILMKTVRLALHVDLMSVHVPTPQLSNIGVAAQIVASLFGRVFVVRQFSGTDSTELCLHKRRLAARVVQNSAVLFVEARKQCENIRECFSREAFWYPNCRLPSSVPPEPREETGQFVYIGRVRDDKGIGDIIKAASLPGPPCSVDVYGPCERPFTRARFRHSAQVRYRGEVDHRNVPSVLSRYQALLLPTYWVGEGYPGTVIEAFQAGVPVVATRWKYLPEIVDETCGILVEPKDPVQLRRAMDRLTEDGELRRRLQRGALARGEEFSADRWADLFIHACHIAWENSDDRPEMERRIRSLYARALKHGPAPWIPAAHEPKAKDAVERGSSLPSGDTVKC